jgi:DNA-binding transcriptional ArsR family regulator
MSSVILDLDRTFAALADPHRREILERVSRGPIAASPLAASLGMTVTGVLKHLHALEDAQLVTTRKVGRTRWCQLAPDALDNAATWISSRRRLWDRRLDRFQAHLEEHGEPGS